jgi:hypothetical protein
MQRVVLYQFATHEADPRKMKLCPIHRALFARWVGDHKGQSIGKSRCCFFLGHDFSRADRASEMLRSNERRAREARHLHRIAAKIENGLQCNP